MVSKIVYCKRISQFLEKHILDSIKFTIYVSNTKDLKQMRKFDNITNFNAEVTQKENVQKQNLNYCRLFKLTTFSYA